MRNPMTFALYEKFLHLLLDGGYSFQTHREFVTERTFAPTILLRHDVDCDANLRAIDRLTRIEKQAGVRSTLFLRLHDPDYNVLGYRELHVLDRIQSDDFEVGLHCETVDLAVVAPRFDAVTWLQKDLDILRAVLGTPVFGIAPHGDFTEYNNQDVLERIDLHALGIQYHAYQKDCGLFSGWYISNYHGNNWKRYVNGELRETAQYGFMDYAEMALRENANPCIFSIHPRPWHDLHYLVM